MPRYLDIKDHSRQPPADFPSSIRLDRRVKAILWSLFAGVLAMVTLGMVFSNIL